MLSWRRRRTRSQKVRSPPPKTALTSSFTATAAVSTLDHGPISENPPPNLQTYAAVWPELQRDFGSFALGTCTGARSNVAATARISGRAEKLWRKLKNYGGNNETLVSC